MAGQINKKLIIQRLRFWCKKLHINPRFDINYKLCKNDQEMPPEFATYNACIDVDLAYYDAVIYFNCNRLNKSNLDNTIIHELLHIIVEPLSNMAEMAMPPSVKDLVRIATESTIENLIPAILGDNKIG